MTEFLQRIAAERKNSTKRTILFFVSLFLIYQVSQAQPTTQASNILISPVSGAPGTLKFDWTAGNAANNQVVIIRTVASTFVPANAADQAVAGTAFPTNGGGADLDGTGQIAAAVFNSTGTTVTVSGLLTNVAYTILIFEYTGTGGSTAYNYTANANNPRDFRFFLSTQNWNVPTGIINVLAQAWGGGAGGSGRSGNSSSSGGGGGGAYSAAVVDVTGGSPKTVTVGATRTGTNNGNGNDGNDSWFIANNTLFAQGGGGGTEVQASTTGGDGGIGGQASNGFAVGTSPIKLNGGTADDGLTTVTTSNGGGPGGSSAGVALAGQRIGASPTWTTVVAVAGPAGSGQGGNGGAGDGDGLDGKFPGGGGGGSGTNDAAGNQTGGDGAAGLIILSWTQPTPVVSVVAGIPATNAPVFKVVFSSPITPASFVSADVSFTGSTATGTLAGAVTEIAPLNGTTFTVTVTGMTASGNVVVAIPATTVKDPSNNDNLASNAGTTVAFTFETTKPDVAITVVPPNPTNVSPVFKATFSEPILNSSFIGTDVTLTGTAGATTAVIAETGPMDGTQFNITVTGMTGVGTVIANMAAGVVNDRAAAPNTSTVSTPANVTINFDNVAPSVTAHTLANITPTSFDLSVTINEAVTTYYVVSTTNSLPSAANVIAGSGPAPVIASGNFAVAAATPTVQNISGLTALTQYYVYTVSVDAATNQSTPVTSDNATTLCTPPGAPATVAGSPFLNITAIAMRVQWVRGTGTGGVIVLAHQTTAVTGPPVSGNNYSGQINANFTSAPTIASGDKVVYRGTGTFVDVVGLLPSTTYHYAVYEYNTTNDCYLLTTPLVQSQATTAAANEGLLNNATGAATISSLIVTQGAEVTAFTYDVTDGGTDGAPTLITDMTIVQEATNFFTSLNQLISGADLTDGTNTMAGTVSASDIQFLTIPTGSGLLGEVLNGATKTYTLKIYLNNPLNVAIRSVADGKNLILQIGNGNVTTAGVGSGGMAAATVNSGTGNGVIDVVGTELRFIVSPSNTDLLNTMTTVTMEATDSHGARDRGYVATVGLTSTGTLLSPQSATFALGLASYPSIIHNAPGAGLTMTTTSALSNPVSGTFNIVANNESNIITSAFAYPQNIQYETLQENSDISHLTTTSIVVGKFDLQDGGNDLTDTDGAPTVLNSLRLNVVNSAMLRRVAIYDATGTVELGEQVAAPVMTFPLTITANDNSFNSFFIRVSFKPVVTDNAQISFTVAAPTTTTATGSSVFTATNAGGAATSIAGNNNKIEVTAAKLNFMQQPTPTPVGNIMSPSPTVEAIDALNNRDVDFISTVDIISSGSLLSSPEQATFVLGVGTYTSVIHNVSGSGLKLTASFGSLTDANSSIFTVTGKTSNIIATAGFTYPTLIPYDAYQEPSNIVNSTTSLVVASFDIQDGGGVDDGDNQSTDLTGLTLDLGANFAYIRRVALYDEFGTTEIPGADQLVGGSPLIVFSGLPLSAPHNSFTTFTVRVSFTTAVVDQQQFSIKINAAVANPAGSIFAAGNAGGAITSIAGNDNRIEVTATQLKFITQPTNTLNGVTMSNVVVHALDILNVRDQGVNSSIGIISSGVMSPVIINTLFASGIGTYSTVVHTSNGAGLTLQTNSGTLSNVPSNTFNITSSNASDIAVNGSFVHPTNIPYLNFQESINIQNNGNSLNVAQFDIRDGGGSPDADLAPTTLTAIQFDLGANFGYIRRIALYDAAGTSEIASDVVVGSQFVAFPLPLSAPDGGTATFTVRVSFTTAVADNQQFSIKVNNTATQANTSSTFPVVNAGGATSSTAGNDNKIEVTATKIVFSTNVLSPLLALVNLSPTQIPNPVAKTLDAANNIDLDYATPISIGCAISINTPSINSDSSAPNAGTYTFPNGFQYNVTGNGQLTLTSGGLTSALSNPVSVTAGTGSAITAGAASPNTIPSTATAAGTQVPVFFFNVIDDKPPVAAGNDDGLPTLITNITISQNGAFNSSPALSDWTQAIAGIELHDNSGNVMNVSTAGAPNVLINATSIQFLNIPNAVGQLGYIADNATKNYDLRIFLKSAMGPGLPAIVDGKQFEFAIFNTSIGVGGNTSTLGAATSTTSGNKNVVDVLATKLNFIYPDLVTYTIATPASASLNSNFPGVSVESVDINGNRDLNFTAANSTVRALTNATGQSMANDPVVGSTQFTAGLLNFAANFQYTSGVNNQNVTLTLTAGATSGCTTDYTTTGICGTSGRISLLASSETWIKPDPTFTFTTNVPYNNYQASNIQAVDITNGNGSFEIGRLLLSDGDADGVNGDPDGAASTLTDIRIGIRDAIGTSTLDQIQEIAIYNSGVLPATELKTHTITGTDVTAGYVDFTGLNIVCADNNLLTLPQNVAVISVRVSFKGALATIVDKTLLRLSVESPTMLSGGSQFYTGGPSPIAGYPNGYKAPTNVNLVDVIATKLVFTTQPNGFAGVNEAINAVEVQSWDANNYLDVDLNAPATVTAPTAPSANPTGTFSFVNGKLDLSSLRYTNTGNGTLLATTSLPSPVLSSTNSCNAVNVIQITGVPDLGGSGGVPAGAFATLQAGVRNVAIFGIQFRSNYNVLAEPTLTGFTVDFSRSNNSTYTNFRVLESPIAGGSFSLGLQDISAAPINATVTPGTNNLVVVFPTPRPFTPLQTTYTYYVVVDVVATVNGSTPNIQLSVLDNGGATASAPNVTATPALGSQLVNVQGPSINFASVQPPFLVSSYPALAQDNIETSQNRIELTFSVPVFTLDGHIRLYETGAVPPNFRILNVDNAGPQNGDYLTNPATANAARPVKFIIPGGFLQSDKQYHIIIDQGIYNASTKVGIADVNNNVFPGILYEGTLYFRTTNSAAPALLGATSTANPPGVTAQNIGVTNLTSFEGTLSGTFDKKGTSYFMVVTAGSPAPTNVQIKNDPLVPPPAYSAPLNIISRGSFPINATTTISQSGTIVPSAGSFTGGAALDVWVCAETTTEANHSPTKVLSLPYGGATNFLQGTPGPTLSFVAPANGTNAPGGTQTGVTTNRLNASLCSGSFQTLNSPIIFYEGTVTTFSIGAFQTLNLALPGGFIFDTSTDAGGTPLFANVILRGADFLGFAPVVRFLSPTVLRITFANFGNTSTDQIIISNLRIFAPTATSGDIFRIGGNALPTITDGTPVANLRANDAKLVYFDNSYSTSLGYHLAPLPLPAPPPTTPSNLETAIPDNTQPALVTLTPYISDTFDHGPSIFTGQGVSINQLNVAGVTKDTPFNITITHTDHNGCTSQNSVQFVVYDHLEGIKISETPLVLTKNQGPYCAINPNFAIDKINPPTPGNKVRYVNFDNLTVYNLSNLTAKYPPIIPPGAFIDPSQFGGVWDNIVTNLPQQGAMYTPPLGGTYYDYTFDDADILGAATISPSTGLPYVYDLYWNQTSKNVNYSTLVNGTSKATYYSGGYLGTVEFTGVFDYASNPAVSIKRRQNIDFYIPAVPVVEIVTPASFLDLGDTANNPGSGTIEAGPNNPGTLVFCEKGPLININGWPSATAGSSKGVFILVKAPYDTTVVSNIIYNKRLGITPVGFVDNQNGTAALDPSKSTILNNYQDIKILYVFKEDKSPCKSSGYQFIRITPNPSALFTQTAVISSNTPTTTSFCVGNQINFDAAASTITPVSGGPSAAQNNLINTYDWNFGDINSATNIATGLTQSHTFNQAQTFAVSLTTTSNWGCASTVTTNNVKVGGIPSVAMALTGVYKGQVFNFHSDGSTVSNNDYINKIDWDFGDLGTANSTYPFNFSIPSGTLVDPETIQPHTYAGIGQKVVNMTLTSAIGCVNSLSLDNLAPIASGGKGLSPVDDIATRTIVVLDRTAVVTGTTGYSEFFDTPSTWQPWYASNTISPLTFPLAGISWDQTSVAPTPGAGDYGTYIKQDPSILTNAGFWRTNSGNSYIPRERSALYSPSFDISALNTPMISYNSLVQLIVSDGVILEYSTDNLNVADPAKVWTVLGSALGEGVGWFTDRGIVAKPGFQSGNDFGWSGATNTNWIISKHTLDEIPAGISPAPANNVVFRFALASTAQSTANPAGGVYEGFAVDNFRIGNRTRTIMLENFSSTSNPSANEKTQNDFIAAFHPALSPGTQVIRINYHVNFPANDPFNLDNPADPSSRALYYGIETTPKSRLDGAPDPLDRNFSIWGDLNYGTRSLALAQADIVITPTILPGKVKIDINVISLLGIPPNSILQVAVVENAVPFGSLSTSQKALVKTGETNFEYVIKSFLPNAAGTRLGPLLAGANQTFTFTWTADPTRLYSPANNLSIVAFVQQEGGIREVYQANNASIVTDPGVVTGVEPIALEDIQVYPIPANREMHIQLPGVLSEPAAIQMIDQTGRASVVDRIPTGASSKVIGTQDLAAGVYILQIDVGNGNITRKKVMVVH